MAGLKKTIRIGGIVVVVAALAACAPKPTPAPPPPPPPPPRPAPIVIPPRPWPPLGASPNSVIPPIVNGQRQTVNTGITTPQITWNFRSAYNVAALNCLQPQHADIVVGYRAFLTRHSRALTAANRAVDGLFRARHGASFVRHREAYMTQVYNFYAFPPTLGNFCDVALEVSREAQAVPVGGLDAFAAQALPRLDQVFENFYRAFEQYRIDVAAWDARYAPAPPAVPVLAPLPVPSPTPSVTPSPQ